MAASIRGSMFCQNAIGKVIQRSSIICLRCCRYNTHSSHNNKMRPRMNVKSIFGQETKDVKSEALSYQQMMGLRQDEASRSVIIHLAKGVSKHVVYHRLLKHGEIRKAIQFGSLKNLLLIEFDKKSAIQKVLREADPIVSHTNLPVHSRMLTFTGSGIRTKGKPLSIVYEDISANEAVNLSSFKTVSEQITALHNSTQLTYLGTRLRFFVCSMMKDMMSGFLPQAQVVPFGSSVNGFGLRNCDLDIMLDMPLSKSKSDSHLSYTSKKVFDDERLCQQRSLALIGDMIQVTLPFCHNVTKILGARVPIVKFRYDIANLDCDLAFKNISGSKMSELMYTYGESDARVRPLVTVIKNWARAKGVTRSSPGSWPTNFTLLMLMVHYLQTRHILPSIRTMQQLAGAADRFDIDGVKYSFTTDIRKLPTVDNDSTLEQLIAGFFTYCVDFDFEKRGISIIEGTDFVRTDTSAMFIENPFELTGNISKNVSKTEVDRIKSEMEIALDMLTLDSAERKAPVWGIMGLCMNGNQFLGTDFKISELYVPEDSNESESLESTKSDLEVESISSKIS